MQLSQTLYDLAVWFGSLNLHIKTQRTIKESRSISCHSKSDKSLIKESFLTKQALSSDYLWIYLREK